MFSIFTSSLWTTIASVLTSAGGVMATLTVVANHLLGKNKGGKEK